MLRENKPNILMVHADTNDLTKQVRSLNSLKKNPEKCSKISPSTELVFSEISLKKDKAGLDKIQKESNGRLKIFCLQK